MKEVALVVFDFDGVMTDNRVQVHQSGEETVWCHRGDGLGIARLKEAGFEIVVLSTEVNPVVGARCRKLKIQAFQGRDDKSATLRQLMRDRSLEPAQIAYVGNDLNDVPCMSIVGWPIAVADAVPEVRALAKWVTRLPGGRGAVREVADRLVHLRRDDDAAVEWVRNSLWRSIEFRQTIAGSGELLRQILRVAEILADVLRAGGSVFILADGPGAPGARRLAAGLAPRVTRHASSVTTLTLADDSSPTGIVPDDDSADLILAPELAGQARSGDLAVGLITGDDCPAVLHAMDKARDLGLRTVLVTGVRTQGVRGIADECLTFPADDARLLEEAHLWLRSVLSDYADRALSDRIPHGMARRTRSGS